MLISKDRRGPCLLGHDANTRKRFLQSHWPLERFSYWPTLFPLDEPLRPNEAPNDNNTQPRLTLGAISVAKGFSRGGAARIMGQPQNRTCCNVVDHCPQQHRAIGETEAYEQR